VPSSLFLEGNSTNSFDFDKRATLSVTMATASDATWATLEPKHGTGMVYCTQLKEEVPPGTFLELTDGKVVRMVSSVRGSDRMKVNVFDSVGDVPFDAPDRPTRNDIRFIPEVLQSDKVVSILAASVKRLAFVLKLADFDRAACSELQGMLGVYLLRNRYNGNNVITEIPDLLCMKFPLSYEAYKARYSESCLPSRVLRGLAGVKRSVAKVLGKLSSDQSTFEVSKGQVIFVDPQVWHHMKLATADANIATHEVSRKRVFRETSSGLDMTR